MKMDRTELLRFYGPVTTAEAETLIEELDNSKVFAQMLKDYLTGANDGRELLYRFQNLCESIETNMIERALIAQSEGRKWGGE